MGGVETLESIVAQRGKASMRYYQCRNGFDLIVGAGLVRVGGVVQSVPCDACDTPHDAEVAFADGTYGIYCSEAGFVPLDVASISAIEPDTQKLVSELASAFDCKRRKSAPIHGKTWRIGAVDTPTGDLALYFHPTLQDDIDVREVQAAFANEVGSAFRLILTAKGTLSASGSKTARLSEMVELASATQAFVPIANPRTIAGAPQAANYGRPSPYADKLASLIGQRANAGHTLNGHNAEARAQLYRARHPDEPAPSLPTIKRFITKYRTGS